ncbi:hypothetical protein N7505_008506 [Penicillium chrysogenum]|uniref:Uncharacterized protein n=1 Tax=Penicillium chrysogenum TaxID=5076 RepID=A0ABQ8W9X1_PENCH|nr:hypothetical protein N7505_008506 [Penicillium chrysogenum]
MADGIWIVRDSSSLQGYEHRCTITRSPAGHKWLFRIVVDSTTIAFALLGASREQTVWLFSLGGQLPTRQDPGSPHISNPPLKKKSQTRNINIGRIHDVFVDIHGFESHYTLLPDD